MMDQGLGLKLIIIKDRMKASPTVMLVWGNIVSQPVVMSEFLLFYGDMGRILE